MGNPAQGERLEIGQDLPGSPIVEPAGAGRPANSRHNLEVDQLRSGELLPTQPLADPVTVDAVVCESRR